MSYAPQDADKSHIQWLCGLNIDDKPAKNYRRTSIIGTIGEGVLEMFTETKH